MILTHVYRHVTQIFRKIHVTAALPPRAIVGFWGFSWPLINNTSTTSSYNVWNVDIARIHPWTCISDHWNVQFRLKIDPCGKSPTFVVVFHVTMEVFVATIGESCHQILVVACFFENAVDLAPVHGIARGSISIGCGIEI